MLLNQDLAPLKQYHMAKRLLWDPQDLDFAQDKRDWQGMDAREHDIVRRGLSLFLAGETYVTHDLAPLASGAASRRRSSGRGNVPDHPAF